MTAIKNKILIEFINNYPDFTFSQNLENNIRKALELILEFEKIDTAIEVSITFCNDSTIQELNKNYRNINNSTDVLSFPIFQDSSEIRLNNFNHPIVLGDVIININQAQKQAKQIGQQLEEEILYLTIHSFLHLVGYDHMNEPDKIKMRNREKEILNQI